jgi:hypothetical protein
MKLLVADKVNLDGHVDEKGVEFIGWARRQEDGTYRCLANIHNNLCLVEVKLIPLEEEKP